jgi:hypothetical protein
MVGLGGDILWLLGQSNDAFGHSRCPLYSLTPYTMMFVRLSSAVTSILWPLEYRRFGAISQIASIS